MRVHPRVVDQADFNSSIVQNNKMNYSSRFYYLLKSDDSYYKARTTLTHYKEEMASFIFVFLWLYIL